MALNGLKGCSSEHVEVRSILAVLAPHIAKCSEPLSAQEVGMALNGLIRLQQRARRSTLHPRSPGAAYCEMFRESSVRRESVMVLNGLNGCSSKHVEVRSILAVLAPHIAKCSEPLSAQEVGKALNRP